MIHHYQTSDGITQYVAVQGHGSPIIFLHGWTSSHREWVGYAEPLSDQFSTYCWDARGHGALNQPPESPVDVQRMAEDLSDLLVHFDLHRAILVGHSMGALTSWEYIRRYGCDRLCGLVIVDQSPKLITEEEWPHGIYGAFSDEKNRHFIARCEADFAEAVLSLVGEGNNPAARAEYTSGSERLQRIRSYLQQVSPQPLIEIWRSLTLQDYRSVLTEITVPTLIIHGDESHFYSVEVAEYLHQRIPQAQLHVYEGTDHSPHLWQRDRFLQDLRTFAQQCSGRNQR